MVRWFRTRNGVLTRYYGVEEPPAGDRPAAIALLYAGHVGRINLGKGVLESLEEVEWAAVPPVERAAFHDFLWHNSHGARKAEGG